MEELVNKLRIKVEEQIPEDEEDVNIPVNGDLRESEAVILRQIANSEKEYPNFYKPLPARGDTLKAKVYEMAREMLLTNKSRDLIDQDELTELYVSLDKYATPPAPVDPEGEKCIGYSDYKKMVASMNDKTQIQKLLTARTFMKLLTDDPFGRVSITLLFSYVMRKIWLIQTRISLSIYDDGGQGFLKEQGLESYVTELIPTLKAQLGGIDSSFLSFYVCTAVRRFFFFLDPNKTGRIRILDILCSGLIDDLLDLREHTPPKPCNWFSYENTMRVYGQYLNLDRDHNGMLSKSELLRYSEQTMTLTPAFIDRVFQECLTFAGEMDYRTYLDFVLALENFTETQSMQYFFRLLDMDQKGFLDAFTIHYFYKDILKCMEEHCTDKIPFEDVKDEIFDMVKPKDPYKITLQDLVSCGKGPTVISILIDFQGFWSYENRENLASDMRLREHQQQQFFLSSEV